MWLLQLEVELNSLDEGANQACYISGLLSELGFGQVGPMALYNNNQSSFSGQLVVSCII